MKPWHRIALVGLAALLFALMACGPSAEQRDAYNDAQNRSRATKAIEFHQANPTCQQIDCDNKGCWCTEWATPEPDYDSQLD